MGSLYTAMFGTIVAKAERRVNQILILEGHATSRHCERALRRNPLFREDCFVGKNILLAMTNGNCYLLNILRVLPINMPFAQ